MRILGRIVRNGHSNQVTIPLAVMRHLRWRSGQRIVVELLEDETVRVRMPTAADIGADVAGFPIDQTLPEVPR